MLIAKLYEIECAARRLGSEARRQMRQVYAKPAARTLHTGLAEQRVKLAKADATARAVDYALSHWLG